MIHNHEVESSSLSPATKIEEDTEESVSFCFIAAAQIYLQTNAVKQKYMRSIGLLNLWAVSGGRGSPSEAQVSLSRFKLLDCPTHRTLLFLQIFGLFQEAEAHQAKRR